MHVDRSSPDVSVVIPAHNAEPTLPACLQSLESQTLARNRYELVVVDNNSRDRSAEVARHHTGVVVVEERCQGAYAARNRGLHIARGHTVAFTDADCVVAPDWLEQVLAALSSGTVVAVGETLPARTTWTLQLLSSYARVKDEYSFGGSDEALYYGRGGNMAALRSVFCTLGPFPDEDRGADALFVRAAVRHYGVAAVRFVAEMRVTHTEVTNLRSYLRKMHIYGYAHHAYGAAAPLRRLTTSERARLLHRATRGHGIAVLPALVLLTGVSQASWRLGRWRAAVGLHPPGGTHVESQIGG